jgi:hypothetical protein
MSFVTAHGSGRPSGRWVRNRKAGSLFQAVAFSTRSWLTGQRQADA